MPDIDYEQQLTLAKQGDMAAFELLILNYERLIYSIAFRMLGNREDALDLAQEVLIKVYKTIEKCPDTAGFKNWVCRITTNACIDEIRKRKNRQTLSFDAENEAGALLNTQHAPEPTPEDSILSQERAKELTAALNCLNETQKSLIILRDINGLSYEEIAETLNMNIGTVKSGISRARLRLRELIILYNE